MHAAVQTQTAACQCWLPACAAGRCALRSAGACCVLSRQLLEACECVRWLRLKQHQPNLGAALLLEFDCVSVFWVRLAPWLIRGVAVLSQIA